MKYIITVTRTETKDFTVEANTPEEARKLVEEKALEHLWGCEQFGTMELSEPVSTEGMESIRAKLSDADFELLQKIINC